MSNQSVTKVAGGIVNYGFKNSVKMLLAGDNEVFFSDKDYGDDEKDQHYIKLGIEMYEDEFGGDNIK